MIWQNMCWEIIKKIKFKINKMETILTILLALATYGFGFLSGTISNQDKTEIEEDHNQWAIHFNSISKDY